MSGKLFAALLSMLVVACSTDPSRLEAEKAFNLATVPVNTTYRVIERAEGKASGFWLLGIIPIYSPSYADAEADLLRRADNIPHAGTIGLANVVQDSSYLYLLLFAVPTKHVRADIVEFNNPGSFNGDLEQR